MCLGLSRLRLTKYSLRPEKHVAGGFKFKLPHFFTKTPSRNFEFSQSNPHAGPSREKILPPAGLQASGAPAAAAGGAPAAAASYPADSPLLPAAASAQELPPLQKRARLLPLQQRHPHRGSAPSHLLSPSRAYQELCLADTYALLEPRLLGSR